MEKIKEIRTTLDTDMNAFDIIMRCKELATLIDLSNIILDNTTIDEKEILINIIEGIRSLELQIIEQPFTPEVQA
tara:strand:+ start:314 stop:538 length:225 start_codon:yes stop_codon:yes gene_type:complete